MVEAVALLVVIPLEVDLYSLSGTLVTVLPNRSLRRRLAQLLPPELLSIVLSSLFLSMTIILMPRCWDKCLIILYMSMFMMISHSIYPVFLQ